MKLIRVWLFNFFFKLQCIEGSQRLKKPLFNFLKETPN